MAEDFRRKAGVLRPTRWTEFINAFKLRLRELWNVPLHRDNHINVKKKNGVHIRAYLYVGYLLMQLQVSSCPLCCIDAVTNATKDRPFLAFVIIFCMMLIYWQIYRIFAELTRRRNL